MPEPFCVEVNIVFGSMPHSSSMSSLQNFNFPFALSASTVVADCCGKLMTTKSTATTAVAKAIVFATNDDDDRSEEDDKKLMSLAIFVKGSF